MQRQKAEKKRRGIATTSIRWATETYSGRLGEYVGVALQHDGLKVGIRTKLAPRWVDAAEALDPAEAEEWVRVGFRSRK
jgi:hypothetical protein